MVDNIGSVTLPGDTRGLLRRCLPVLERDGQGLVVLSHRAGRLA